MKILVVQLVLAIGVLISVSAEEPWPESRFKACENGTVLIAAHRGGYSDDKANGAPENSVANVAVAIRKGYDVYETDIQRTSDGVFVIVHDQTLTRETNGAGSVKDMTLAELKSLKRLYRDGSVSEEPVATLEELLKAGKGKILFKPDLKPGVLDHFDELARLISDLEMTDQVFIRTGFKDAERIKVYFKHGTPKVELMFKTKNRNQVRRIIDNFQPRTIQVDIAKGESLSDGKIQAIQEAISKGVLVETHSYGDSAQWEVLAGLGVRMFHTANPDKTLKYLIEKGWRK